MVNGYNEIILLLRIIGNIVSGPDTYSDYYNYVSRGILSDDFINSGIMYPHYLKGLQILDLMNQYNQKIISQILDAVDETYIISSETYRDIDMWLCPKVNSLYSDNYYKILLNIHYKIIINKLYFLWKSNPKIYAYSINKFNKLISRYDCKVVFADLDNYNRISSLMLETFEVAERESEYYIIFTFLEKIIKKMINK